MNKWMVDCYLVNLAVRTNRKDVYMNKINGEEFESVYGDWTARHILADLDTETNRKDKTNMEYNSLELELKQAEANNTLLNNRLKREKESLECACNMVKRAKERIEKTCEEKRIVDDKIEDLKRRIDETRSSYNVFKCTNAINPYGMPIGAYGVYRAGMFIWSNGVHRSVRVSTFVEVTDFFEGLQNGTVIFVVTKEKIEEFLYVLKEIGLEYLDTGFNKGDVNIFFRRSYGKEPCIISHVFTDLTFDPEEMDSTVKVIMF